MSDKPIANQAADAGGAGQADTNLQPAQQAIPNPGPANTGADGPAAAVDAPADAQQAQRGRSQSLDLGTANALPPTVRPRAASDAAVGV